MAPGRDWSQAGCPRRCPSLPRRSSPEESVRGYRRRHSAAAPAAKYPVTRRACRGPASTGSSRCPRPPRACRAVSATEYPCMSTATTAARCSTGSRISARSTTIAVSTRAGRVGDPAELGVQLVARMGFVAAQPVQARVHDDAVQPAADRRVVAEGACGAVRGQQASCRASAASSGSRLVSRASR